MLIANIFIDGANITYGHSIFVAVVTIFVIILVTVDRLFENFFKNALWSCNYSNKKVSIRL